jgi:hypothetical protein
MQPGSFALTYTVKNEARLLPLGIEYHLALGCSRVYVFWDNTTDDAPELVAKYPQVITRKSYRPEEMEDAPGWLSQILPAWGPDLDVRKRANTYYAAVDAAKHGIEWLLSIDADELILMNRDEQILEDHFRNTSHESPKTSTSCCFPIWRRFQPPPKLNTRSSNGFVS